MKIVQEKIQEPKQPKEIFPEQTKKPEQQPESAKPVAPVQTESKKAGCLAVAYHTLMGLAVLGLVWSAYDQGESIEALEEQASQLRETNYFQNNRLTELEEKNGENLEHLKEMYTWGKAVTQKNKTLTEEVKRLTKDNLEMKKNIQELEKKLDATEKQKVICTINGTNYEVKKIVVKDQKELQR